MEITTNHMVKQRVLRWSWPLITALATGLALLLSITTQTLQDPDIVMHITAGRWMLEHQAVPDVDVFSYTKLGAPWVAHEWLAQCLMAVLQSIAPWTALVVVTVGLFAFTLAYLMRFLLERMPPIYALLMTALAAAAMSSHLLSRPHVMAWPLLAVWMAELIKANEDRRAPPWWLLGVMVLWANLHGSFTLGLVLIGPMALEALVQASAKDRVSALRQWLAFGVAALLAAMVTPYGWHGIVLTLQLTQLSYLQRIGEWMHPGGVALMPLELWLLMFVLMGMLGYLRMPIIRFVMLMGLFHQALMVGRFISVFGLLAPMLLATSFGQQYAQMTQHEKPSHIDLWFERFKAPANGLAVLFVTLTLLVTGSVMHTLNTYNVPAVQNMAPAMQAARLSGAQGHVLNSFNLGAALISQGVPVFIDGRADLYGEDHMRTYFDLMESNDPKVIEQVLDRYRINWTVLLPKSSLLLYLNQNPAWDKVYEDAGVVVHLRREQQVIHDIGQKTRSLH
jgi:hypothetical protein